MATNSTGIITGAQTNANQLQTGQTTDQDPAAQASVPPPTVTNAQTPNANSVAQVDTSGATGAPPAAKMSTTDWKVTPDQTVQGQLSNVLDSGSPVLQKAQADAMQTANSRGLLNSSIAAGAGTAAVLDKALQIATPDAQTNAAAGQFNANASNASSSQNASATNALQSQQLGIISSAASQDASAKNASSQQQFSAALQTALANADASNKASLTAFGGAVQTNLANIEAQFKQQLQTSASAAAMYQSTISTIGQILNNKDLTPEAMQNAINQEMNAFQTSMKMQAAIGAIPDLDSLIGNLSVGVPVAPTAGTGSTGSTGSTGGGAGGNDNVTGGGYNLP